MKNSSGVVRPVSSIPTGSANGLVEHIVDALEGIGTVQSKRFFGGIALLLDGIQFGFYVRGELYFRVDDGNRGVFEEFGSHPFQYSHANGKLIVVKSFYTVPEHAMDERQELCALARGACAAGLRIDQAKNAVKPKAVRAVAARRARSKEDA